MQTHELKATVNCGELVALVSGHLLALLRPIHNAFNSRISTLNRSYRLYMH